MKVLEHPEGPGAEARSKFFEAFRKTSVGRGGGAAGRWSGGRRGARIRACAWPGMLPGGAAVAGSCACCGDGGVAGRFGTSGGGTGPGPVGSVVSGGSKALSRSWVVCLSFRADRPGKLTV